MSLVRLWQRFGNGWRAVQPTDQIACDISLATVTLPDGSSTTLKTLFASASLGALLSALPTSPPSTPGLAWLDNGVPTVSS